ncbi:helix-turn-helix domain-containing protein [Bacillaceae bacterium S4-13-58]
MNDDHIVPNFVEDLLTASNNGLNGISDALSTLLHTPVIITDSLYHILSMSQFEYKNDGLQVMVEPSPYQEDSMLHECFLVTKNGKESALRCIISFDQKVEGFLFAVGNPQKMETSLLKLATSLCSMNIKKNVEIVKEKKRYKDAFLYNLLYGNMKEKADIVSYGHLWRWDFEEPMTVIVFSIEEYNMYTDDKNLIEALFYIVKKALTQHQFTPILLKKRNEVTVIFPTVTQSDNQKEDLTQLIHFILNQTKDTQLEDRVRCGIGRTYENPVEIFRSYQEAKVAYELGLLLNISLPFFEDLGLERILYKHDLQDLKEFYYHVLGRIEALDVGKELMITIEQLAKNQFDLKRTSDAMFIHKNTLRYRIKKIEEVLQQKLDDVETRLNISAALKIKQLHKV